MAYVRKTKDIYSIMWSSEYGLEEIDCFDTWAEAKSMIGEYRMAYHNQGRMYIKKRRERI